MKTFVWIAVGFVVLGAAISIAPDFRRYMRIRSM